MLITSPADIDFIPQRIVSLVPSVTELLSHFELDAQTAGITKFCVNPEEWFRSKPRMGGTKNLNIQKITELHPDLILCNKEENVKEQVEMLAEKFPVYVSDVPDYAAALQMIRNVGMLTGKVQEAENLVAGINSKFDEIKTDGKKIRAAYLIWKDPYMTIGGDTFISDMIDKAGFENVFKNADRYPEISLSDLKENKPDVILLSSEPYPFKQKHAAALQELFPASKVLPADGEMFSWYGSRMLYAPEYFKTLRNQVA